MQFVLHIGTNKTGTSSIQRAFFENREALKERGVIFPLTGLEPNTPAHHHLSRVLRGRRADELGMEPAWRDHFVQEIREYDTCVLSSENFHTIPNPECVANLLPKKRTKVVVYLREHATYMISWYQQAVQSRNTAMDLPEFVDAFFISFTELVDRWAKVFGRKNVIVRQYDRRTLKNGDVVADLASIVQPGLESVFENDDFAFNQSVAGNLLFAKRLLNCFITKPESLSIANEISAMVHLDPTFKGKIEVDQSVVKRAAFLAKNDRITLKKRYGLDLIPRHEGIEGALYPDMSRLKQDIETIRVECKRRNFKADEYFERMFSAL